VFWLGLFVAFLVVTLMVSCFLAGRQFQSVASSLSAGDERAVSLVSRSFKLGGDAGPSEVDDVSVRPLETFQEVMSHLRRQYVSPVEDEKELTYGAVRGMLSVLRGKPYEDRYSRFLDPKEYRAFLDENEGHFGGIGAEIGLREAELPSTVLEELSGLTCPVCGADITNPKRFEVVVIAPLPNSPAERSGLQPGDHILKVDDTLTAGLSLGQVVQPEDGVARGVLVPAVVSASQDDCRRESCLAKWGISAREQGQGVGPRWRLLHGRGCA